MHRIHKWSCCVLRQQQPRTLKMICRRIAKNLRDIPRGSSKLWDLRLAPSDEIEAMKTTRTPDSLKHSLCYFYNIISAR